MLIHILSPRGPLITSIWTSASTQFPLGGLQLHRLLPVSKHEIILPQEAVKSGLVMYPIAPETL